MKNRNLAARVATRALDRRVARSVVSRLRVAEGGKFLGKDCRLKWDRHEWYLEELPQKGKKKLKKGTLRNPAGYGHFDWFIPDNVLRFAKLSASDDYSKIKAKMLDAYKEAYKKTLSNPSHHDKEWMEKGNSDWIGKIEWYEEDVFYLKVTPEGTDPFTAEGKDFQVQVKWDSFKAYSPNSDFQSHDPHYTMYSSKSPQGARKLYITLKSKPDQLKTVSWNNFKDWLDKNKIPSNTNFSQW
jgi:hypothetical protein